MGRKVRKMTPERLTKIIDMCAEGVGNSQLGPLMQLGQDDNFKMQKQINPLCFQLLIITLGKVIELENNEQTKSTLN